MSVPFSSPIADEAVEILTARRLRREPQQLSDALAASFPGTHWSMTDEHLDYAHQLVRSAAALASGVRDGSLDTEEALRRLREKYAPFSEDALRRALTFAVSDQSA